MRNQPSREPSSSSRWFANERGFSLIELSLAMFIFGLLTVLVLANFRHGRQANDLRFAAQQLAQDLRDMQGRALAGQTVSVNATPTVPKGYGLRVTGESPNNLSYKLFADVDGCEQYVDPPDVTLSTRTLPKDVRISGFSGNVGNPATIMDIVFQPPQAAAILNAVCASGNSCTNGVCSPLGGALCSGSCATPDTTVTITFVHDRINVTRTVIVNRLSGQVSVQ